jgi:hypothetical protein
VDSRLAAAKAREQEQMTMTVLEDVGTAMQNILADVFPLMEFEVAVTNRGGKPRVIVTCSGAAEEALYPRIVKIKGVQLRPSNELRRRLGLEVRE